jgi:hypothetical protein
MKEGPDGKARDCGIAMIFIKYQPEQESDIVLI